jgi:two-component system, NarL family, sensor histidine kinase DesK
MTGWKVKTVRDLGWETYAWLIYSLPYLVSAFNARLSAAETAAMLVAYVAFLALYLAGQLVRGPRILLIVAGVNLIAIGFSQRNFSAVSFFIYGAALLGPAFPPRQAAIGVALQVVFCAAASAALGLPPWYYLMMALITALIGAVCIQAAVTAAKDAKLRLAQAEVERLAKLAERERIARDLHDLLGHTLSVVVLKSELARKLIEADPSRAAKEIGEVERIARDGLAEVRQAITGYRASGLAAEIARVRDALVTAGIDATIETGTVPLALAQEAALSLALREATTNVIRHAGATRCHIRFYARDGSVLMEVEDNGRGGDAPFGNGLTGMRERIQALGGVLRRDTDRGTRILIKLPI